jgi:ribosomal protein L7/L12
MTIEVLPQVRPNKPDEIFHISFNEAVIVQHVYAHMGKVSAVRVVRAFAKCGLTDALNYVNSLER